VRAKPTNAYGYSWTRLDKNPIAHAQEGQNKREKNRAKGVQLSLISTTYAACELASQAASFFYGNCSDLT